jgi:flagellar hook-associated protein 2
LVSLKLDAQDKDIVSELQSRKSTISDEKIFSVTNTSTAALGSYDVEVGTNIPEKLISRSYDSGKAVFDISGLTPPYDNLEINVGDPASPKILILEPVDLQPGDTLNVGQFDVNGDLQSLADAINAQAQAEGIALSASLQADKTKGGVEFKRLVLTATDGGSANRISIKNDPTDLHLGENFVDDPVLSTFVGSDAAISMSPNTAYTGQVNKSFTFVSDTTGVLGTDEIIIKWADTEGHSGTITLPAGQPFDKDQDYEVMQGVFLRFDMGTNGRFVQNESFSVDCQAPILQKGQDSGLAQTAKLVHQGFADQVSPINTGGGSAQFSYSYQGQERTISVDGSMSLAILANAINSASDNPGVTASIVNDGMGTATSYHLVLTGNHTGAESEIKILDGTTLDGFGKDAFTTSREATNAMLKVDGFPSGTDNWMQRRTNDVSDAIDGVILNLTGTGKSTLTISNDFTAIRDKIVQLVESVNFCKQWIIDNTKWGESNLTTNVSEDGTITTTRENPNGIMIGNYGFQIAQSKLDSLMNRNLVPFSEDPSLDTKAKLEKRQKYLDDNGLVYSTLSEIGITSDPDNKGLYKVEQSKLLECITQNPDAVIKLFTFTDEYIDKDSSGRSKTVTISGFSLAMGNSMAELTSTDDILDQEGNLVQKGKGIMVTLQENYQGIIEDINEKIAREERRIEAVRSRLTDRFNRLETALQQLEDQQAKLESSISSLSSSSS